MRPSILTLLLIAVLGALVGSAEAEVFRWVDRDGTIHYSNAPSRTSPAPSPDRLAQVEDILERSGLTRQLADLPELIHTFLIHCGVEARLLAEWRLADILQRAFQGEVLYAALQRGLVWEFDSAELSALMQWYRSPLSRQMVALMVMATSPESGQAIRGFAAQLAITPPTPLRLALTERLDAALEGTELWIDIALTVMGKGLAVRRPGQEKGRLQGIGQVIQQLRAQRYPLAKLNNRMGLLFAYRSVSDDELRQFTEFWEAPLGKRFTRRLHQSLLEAVNATTAIAAAEITAEAVASLRPKDAPEPPLTSPQQWALATSALLTQRNAHRHDLLAGTTPNETTTQRWKYVLQNSWGINNRIDLFSTLKWLYEEGHRKEFDQVAAWLGSLSAEQRNALMVQRRLDEELDHRLKVVEQYSNQLGGRSLLGWDLSRYISLCRWGYLVGYLSEAEAWELITPAAQRLQQTFASWTELGDNYLIGREFWSLAETRRNGHVSREAYQRLLDDPRSPWNRLPWNTGLSNASNPSGR